MLSFFQQNAVDAGVIKFLRCCGFNIAPQLIISELDKHPDYPSLLAVSDVLTNFNVANSAFRVAEDELESISTPFIAHMHTDGGSMMIVHNMESKTVTVSTAKWHKRKLSRNHFAAQYAGVVLELETNPAASSAIRGPLLKRIQANVLIIPTVIILLLLLVFNSSFFERLNWELAMIALVKSGGLIVSILLLTQIFDQNNPLVQVLCKAGGKKSDCNSLLSSKASMAFLGYRWSEIGFFYFGGTWLLALFGNGTPLTWQVLMLLNLISLPYTFYSIYYQAKVAKQWCVLCCVVQALFWTEFIPLLSLNLSLPIRTPILLKDITIPITSLLSPVVLWYFLKPLLVNFYQLPTLKDQLRKFKYNAGLFHSMLNGQPKFTIPDKSWTIVMGNAETDNIITVVTNPYCQPCAKTHNLLDQLLDENSNLQARIVFTALNIDNDEITSVARHMMALYELPDKSIVKKAMNDWYNGKHKKYEIWAKQYPIELKEANFLKLDKQKTWCDTVEIKGTPTVLVNGHVLPPVYQLPDLKYMMGEPGAKAGHLNYNEN